MRQGQSSGFPAKGGKLEPRSLVIVSWVENHRTNLKELNGMVNFYRVQLVPKYELKTKIKGSRSFLNFGQNKTKK